jgi:hypothetical protein
MNGAYITFAPVFVLDKAVAEKIDQLGELVTKITEQSIRSTEYNDEYVVGSGGQDENGKALNTAIKAANAAIAGHEKTISVPIDEYETDENGAYVYYDGLTGDKLEIMDGVIPDGAQMKQLTADVTYIEINLQEIENAILNINAMLNDEKYKNITGFAPSSVEIPAGDKAYKSVTIAHDGTYRIEISGASGGHAWTSDSFPAFGGKGGHIIAEREFKAGNVLKVRVGQEGDGTAKLADGGQSLIKDNSVNYKTAKAGGWPNGGTGAASYSGGLAPAGGGGGGATEVYYAGSYGTTDLKVPGGSENGIVRVSDLILVAGGGGGAASANSDGDGSGVGHPGIDGGDAGSLAVPAIKRDPREFGTISVGQYYFAGELNAPYDYIPAGTLTLRHTKTIKTGSGGKSNTPYSYGGYASNSDVIYGTAEGQGATGKRSSQHEAPGGGGGGYVGGNATNGNGSLVGSGGGGSNYVKKEYSFNVAAGSNSVSSRYGNGAFSIEYVDKAGGE